MEGLGSATIWEVDQKTTFDVKEPLMQGEPLMVKERHAVAVEFDKGQDMKTALLQSDFNTSVPTTWLLEGLLMYLSLPDTVKLMQDIGQLSAPGSAVFHDAISHSYLNARIVV